MAVGLAFAPSGVTVGEPPPTANFTGTPTIGLAPLTVAFTDTSSGTVSGWDWDFQNNGSTDSTTQNPSFEYVTAGVYSVKLTVAPGSDSETKTDYITVLGDPSTISGLRFWQEADAIEGKVTDDSVTQWDDASGNGNHLLMVVNPNAPAYRATDGPNSLPCLRFVPTDDMGITGLAADTAFTVFLAVKKRSAPSAVLGHTLWATNVFAQILTNANVNATGYEWFANQTNSDVSLPNAVTVTDWHIVTLRINSAGSIEVYVNGGTPTSFNPNDNLTTATIRRLCSDGTGGNHGDYDVYAYLEYDSSLSDSDLNSVGEYLAAKTAITWTDA